MVKLDTLLSSLAVAGSLLQSVIAHPGEAHDHEEYVREIAKRNLHARNIARGLEKCARDPSYLALQARAHERRAAKAKALRQKRGIDQQKPYKTKRSLAQRDLAALETFETYNHNLTIEGYASSTEASVLFANYNNISCILTPEVTQGPYYITGEFIRSNVVEDQEGVPVHLEYQYIDISTCEAATGLYLDTWQANSTGVYSGIVSSGNGNSADSTNLNNTFLRGMQPVDADGVAAFDTLFAGHYEGRATHIHLIAHQDGTVLSNGTYSGGTISHVGQIFFPTDLKDAVEATYPYNTNTQTVTTNDEDMWAPDQAENSYDPFPDYAYLGDDISDGLLMWISVGINMSAEYTVSIAGTYTANGGEASSGGFSGGSDNGGCSGGSGAAPSGNSTMGSGNATAPTGGTPTGGMPTGSMSSPGGACSGNSTASSTSVSFPSGSTLPSGSMTMTGGNGTAQPSGMSTGSATSSGASGPSVTAPMSSTATIGSISVSSGLSTASSVGPIGASSTTPAISSITGSSSSLHVSPSHGSSSSVLSSKTSSSPTSKASSSTPTKASLSSLTHPTPSPSSTRSSSTSHISTNSRASYSHPSSHSHSHSYGPHNHSTNKPPTTSSYTGGRHTYSARSQSFVTRATTAAGAGWGGRGGWGHWRGQ